MQNETGANLIWNGALRFNDQTVTNVDMFSTFKEMTKPYLLSSTLEVDKLITWSDVLDQELIHEIASSTDLCKKLTNSPCVEVKLRKLNNVQYFYTSYLTLSSPNSDAFKQVHNSLRRSQYAGLSILPSGAIFLLIPNGDLSTFLTLPSNLPYAIFHCLIITLGPLRPLTGNDTSHLNMQRILDPREDELVGPRSKTLAKVAQFNAEWSNRMHGSGETMSSNRFSDVPTSSSSAGGHYGSRPSTPTTLTTGNGGQRSSNAFSQSLPRERGLSSAHTASNFSSGHDKNRDLFKQTLQNVKNFGKDQPTDPRTPPISSSDSRQETSSSSAVNDISAAFPSSVLKDPRLRRITNNESQSVNKVLGLDPLKHSESTTSSSMISELNRPYSPSQTMQAISSVPEPPSVQTPVRPLRDIPPSPIVNIPLERVDTLDTGIITPSKFFANISAIANDSMNIFAGSFATSTPKAVEPKIKTGLNFDILNWNARESRAEESAGRSQSSAVVSNDSPASPSEAQKTVAAGGETLIPLTKQDDDDEEDSKLRIADDDEPSSPASDNPRSDNIAKVEEKVIGGPTDSEYDRQDPMDISTSEDDGGKGSPPALEANGHNNGTKVVKVKTEISDGGPKEHSVKNLVAIKEGNTGRLSPCDIKMPLPPPGVINTPRVAGPLPPSHIRQRTTLLPFAPPFAAPSPPISMPPMPVGYGTGGPPPPFGMNMPPSPFGSGGPFGAFPNVSYPGVFGDFAASLLNVASQPSYRPVSQVRPFLNNAGGTAKKPIDPNKEKNLAQQAISVFNRSPPKTPAACSNVPEAIPIPSSAPPTPSSTAVETTKTNLPEASTTTGDMSCDTETGETTFIQNTIGIPFLPDDDTDIS